MRFDYLAEIGELHGLYAILSEDGVFGYGVPDDYKPWKRCQVYGEELEKLVNYVFDQRFPNSKRFNKEFIKLIKDKAFRTFLGHTEYYNKIHFVYLAYCNSSFDHNIDEETAALALECLKEVTYVIFSKLNDFSEEETACFQYVTNINRTLTEAKTREVLIDVNLVNAGYKVNNYKDNHGHGKPGVNEVCVEIEVHNLPHQSVGYVDYVIYNKKGDPVAVIEAKRTSVNEGNGAQQAKDYADALVKDLNLPYRPIVYYTNGYNIKIQDRLGYPARPVSNFGSLEDIERLIKRQKPGLIDQRNRIANKEPDKNIINRAKLIEATHDLVDAMDVDMKRKGLLVLPCGVGKTRTAVALSKILIDSDWVENVLFLADRNNLVDNALKPFKKYMSGTVSDISAENPDKDLKARFCLCTYNSMLSYLNSPKKEFSVGHFDLIIVDEAHRTLFNVYRAIFEYFDSFVVGLTATPSTAIDRSTYDILDLRLNEPTFELKFEEAVNLGYLVSYKAFDKSSALAKKGLRRSDVPPEQLDEFDAIAEQGGDPDYITGEAFKKELLNKDTIDRMFADLFKYGLRVDNGNKIGKTLIFASDSKHADAIEQRFKEVYPMLGDDFCQTIYHAIKKNKTRQTNFAKKDSNPQIVISVDMMDTGVDIPEIVNLVFYKRVLSRIKFDQMWGRGTRTCEGLKVVSPCKDYFEGRSKDDERQEYMDKQGFFVFDYGGNFAYFEEHPEGNDPSVSVNLNQKLYSAYLHILMQLQNLVYQAQPKFKNYYDDLKEYLIGKITDLNHDRADVHKELQMVDKYSDPNNWVCITNTNIYEIENHLLKLIDPDSVDDVYSKSFEYRIAVIQLSLLDTSVDSGKQQKQLLETALKLSEKASIPDVMAKAALLLEIQDEHFFENLEFFKLEKIKREIGPLVRYLKGESVGLTITNFNDQITTTEREVKYKFDDFRTYKEKAVAYIKKHYGEINAIQKILNLEELDEDDLKELQTIFDSLKTENDEDLFANSDELIIFIRKVLQLDRKTIDEKFASFLNETSMNKEQRRLIDLIIDFAIANGNITADDLTNTSPFDDIDFRKTFGNDVGPIIQIINAFNNSLHISA